MATHITNMRRFVALSVTATLLAAVQPVPAGAQTCPAGGLAQDSVAAGVAAPRPLGLATPPLPVPNGVRGSVATIRVVVDTTGRAVRDSILVCGLKDRGYAKRLAAAVAAVMFQPARAAGRPIAGATVLTYRF